jgi:regulator of sigma E protease
MWEIVKLLFNGLKALFTGQVAISDLSGPVGIAKETHEVYAHMGLSKSLQWIGILNLNLAIMNLIPIPGLDGGRLLLIGLEKMRIKLSEKVETGVILAGMFVVIAFMLTGTWNDIASFFK